MPVKGVRTTFGSKLYENYIPEEDDTVVKRLRDAGCVILGKTNMPEFGFYGVTYNKVFGITRNPWNLERTPGGSSGGAAAAMASGLGFLALGADGGGSIRIPSNFCGVYGIKASQGRVPLFPTVGILSELEIDQYGPIVRYVEDAALMLDIIKGPIEADKYSLPKEDVNYLEKINEKPKKLKIGYSLDLGVAKVIDEDVKKSVVKSAKSFEKLGWEVEEANIKLKKPHVAINTIWCSFYAYDLKSELRKWKDEMDPDLVKLIEAGLSFKGMDVMNAMDLRKQIYMEFYEFFKNYDILLTPVTAIPAFPIGILFPSTINGINVSPTGWIPFTHPFNMTGHPAASIPCGFSKEGLPIGMQIVGPRFSELLVLQVSKAFQDIAPWQDNKPTID
jgi:aspartyl-tRNA(Asn)/glutamyl-tRNA(Gln) amidotransferase subunit A